MGSVKDLEVVVPPEEQRMGVGRFHFSERYSVFDWGEMPDRFSGRGKALCAMAAYFFERMAEAGIRTHYLGVEQGLSLKEVSYPPSTMTVQLVRVIVPPREGDRYDYQPYQRLSGNYLLPLEVIYRFFLPPGASVFKRLEKGWLRPQDLGVEEVHPGMLLPRPFIDFSTKLEAGGDRYLDPFESREVAGLKEQEFEELKRITLAVSALIKKEFEGLGIQVEDGKLEFALTPERQLMVVDVAGTPDECRLSWEGIPLSKELLREYYRRTPWYQRVEEEKGRGSAWREKVPPPPPLPREWKEGFQDLCMALANALVKRELFPGKELAAVIPRVRSLYESLQEVPRC